MTQPQLLELAKQGDPRAIAALMNRSLQPKGMTALVDRQGDCLEVMLEAERIPNRQALTAFVQKGINNLGIDSVNTIRVLGRQVGSDAPAWMQEIYLATPTPDFEPEPPPLETDSTPPEPEAVPEPDHVSPADVSIGSLPTAPPLILEEDHLVELNQPSQPSITDPTETDPTDQFDPGSDSIDQPEPSLSEEQRQELQTRLDTFWAEQPQDDSQDFLTDRMVSEQPGEAIDRDQDDFLRSNLSPDALEQWSEEQSPEQSPEQSLEQSSEQSLEQSLAELDRQPDDEPDDEPDEILLSFLEQSSDASVGSQPDQDVSSEPPSLDFLTETSEEAVLDFLAELPMDSQEEFSMRSEQPLPDFFQDPADNPSQGLPPDFPPQQTTESTLDFLQEESPATPLPDFSLDASDEFGLDFLEDPSPTSSQDFSLVMTEDLAGEAELPDLFDDAFDDSETRLETRSLNPPESDDAVLNFLEDVPPEDQFRELLAEPSRDPLDLQDEPFQNEPSLELSEDFFLESSEPLLDFQEDQPTALPGSGASSNLEEPELDFSLEPLTEHSPSFQDWFAEPPDANAQSFPENLLNQAEVQLPGRPPDYDPTLEQFPDLTADSSEQPSDLEPAAEQFWMEMPEEPGFNFTEARSPDAQSLNLAAEQSEESLEFPQATWDEPPIEFLQGEPQSTPPDLPTEQLDEPFIQFPIEPSDQTPSEIVQNGQPEEFSADFFQTPLEEPMDESSDDLPNDLVIESRENPFVRQPEEGVDEFPPNFLEELPPEPIGVPLADNPFSGVTDRSVDSQDFFNESLEQPAADFFLNEPNDMPQTEEPSDNFLLSDRANYPDYSDYSNQPDEPDHPDTVIQSPRLFLEPPLEGSSTVLQPPTTALQPPTSVEKPEEPDELLSDYLFEPVAEEPLDDSSIDFTLDDEEPIDQLQAHSEEDLGIQFDDEPEDSRDADLELPPDEYFTNEVVAANLSSGVAPTLIPDDDDGSEELSPFREPSQEALEAQLAGYDLGETPNGGDRPPTEPPPDSPSSEPQGGSPWLFPLILFGVSGWIAALLLGSWLWSKITTPPSPSPVSPPVSTSPSPVTSAPAPEPAAPTDPYQQAIAIATNAVTLSQSAQSADDWRSVASRWEQAIVALQAVPDANPNWQTAQTKISEYQANLAAAQQRASQPIAQAPPSTKVVVADSIACSPPPPSPDGKPVQLSNVQFQPNSSDPQETYVAGCLTNNTEQPISIVSITYGVSSAGNPNAVDRGVGGLNFSGLEPGQTVPFRSKFALTPEITSVTIGTLYWQPIGVAASQEVEESLVINR